MGRKLTFQQRLKLNAHTHRQCRDCGWVLLRSKLALSDTYFVCNKCDQLRKARKLRSTFRIIENPHV